MALEEMAGAKEVEGVEVTLLQVSCHAPAYLEADLRVSLSLCQHVT